MHKLLLVAVVLCFLAGCSLAPEYERPELPVSESYPETGISPESLESPPVVEWHSFFRDPSLIEIIDTALANNRDIRVAGLNADRIRAILRIQETALIPNLDASGDLLRQRTPGDLSFTGQSITRSTYSVGLEVPSYELDFFGKITGLRDQALQEYLASEEAVLNVELSLVSGVARQYFQLLANYEQLEIVDKSLTAAERFYDLTRNAFEAGVGSELDLRTAEAQWETYKANAALLHEQIATSRNNLVFLVGANIPDDLLRIRNLDSQEMLEDIPPGLPSDLLVRRPDIRAAEHQLQAANASIGVARAAFFPSVKLTAFGGSASTELDGLFGSGTGTWSFAPSVTVPIFNSGRNQANLEVTEIERDIRIANYEKTIQGAFREVADALAVQANIQDRLAAQEARIRAARRRFELSEQRFNSGVDSYLPVLLAQQELYAAELSRVLVRLARLSNLTSLYSALGGGWLPVYESP